MATSDIILTKIVVLTLSEEEASYLMSLTQNCHLHNSDILLNTQKEGLLDHTMRTSIFKAIYEQGIRAK